MSCLVVLAMKLLSSLESSSPSSSSSSSSSLGDLLLALAMKCPPRSLFPGRARKSAVEAPRLPPR